MPAALELVGPDDWESVQNNFDTISANLRPAMSSARVFNNANIATVTGTPKLLTFNSERYDNGGLHSTSVNTDRLTVPITGLYAIGGNILWEANAAGYRQLEIILNAAAVIGSTILAPVPGGATTGQIVLTEYQLTAGDFVTLRATQGSGGALNVLTAANYTPEFWMHRISGFTNEGIAV